MILSDEELNAAILESGWTTRGKEATKEFHALARAIEKRVAEKVRGVDASYSPLFMDRHGS
jgi:hypothetical protein